MPESTPTPIITAVGGGRTWNVVGDKIICKVTDDHTHGAYAVVEEISPPQGGPPLHFHRSTDEIFYVIEGEYQVVCGDRTFSAPQGTVEMKRRTALRWTYLFDDGISAMRMIV